MVLLALFFMLVLVLLPFLLLPGLRLLARFCLGCSLPLGRILLLHLQGEFQEVVLLQLLESPTSNN